MSISSALQNAQQKVANAYTAVSNKGGTLPATQNLSNLPTAINTITTSGTVETLNVTPSTSAQQFIATGGVDGYNPVNVSAVTSSIDANITTSNIKDGVTILGVTGEVVELNADSLSVTPTTSAQTITPTSPINAFDEVNVSAVTSSIDNNIKASNIKSGVTILGVSGTVNELNGETKSVSLTDKSGQTFTPTSPKNAITSITVTPNNQARTVTPTTSQQSLTVNTGYSGNGTITVNAVTSDIDSDIKATNIKSGVNILGVNGSVVELNGSSRSVSLTSSSGQTFNPESGKNAITSITVTPNNQARTVNPSTTSQTLSVNSGYSGNGTITVNAVTNTIDENITASNILQGVEILGVEGEVVELNADTISITPTTSAQTITPTSPYNAFDEISVSAVTSSIDSNISAGNIKSGISILGVSGTVTELQGETRSVSITSPSGNTFTPTTGKNGITSITVTPTNKADTITATTSEQTVTIPSGYSGYGTLKVNAVTSAIDSDIISTNIKSGVNILGVNGSVVELNGETKSVSLTNKNGQTFTPTSPKNAITSITVTPNNQARTVTPTTSQQSLSVNSGYSGNGTITINAVTSSIDNNITAGNIKDGVTILGVTGTLASSNFVIDTNNYSGTMNFIVNTDGSMENIKNGNYVVGSADTSITSSLQDAYSSNTTAKFVSLASIITCDNYNLIGAFEFNKKIESADFSSLTTITKDWALNSIFLQCSNFKSIKFDSLSSIAEEAIFATAFRETKLSSLSFPSLNSTSFGSYTNQFLNMIRGVTGCTVHFPSNLQSVIGSWSSVTSGFGGTNTTVLFDLPATT